MQINTLNIRRFTKRIIEVHGAPTRHRKAGVNAQPGQAGGDVIRNFHGLDPATWQAIEN